MLQEDIACRLQNLPCLWRYVVVVGTLVCTILSQLYPQRKRTNRQNLVLHPEVARRNDHVKTERFGLIRCAGTGAKNP